MRSTLRIREAVALLAHGVDRLRFTVARAIPLGGELGDLAAGRDVTADVREGRIPAEPLLTHVRRGAIIVQPETVSPAALDALARTPVGNKDAAKAALRAVGVAVPAHTSSRALAGLKAAALAHPSSRARPAPAHKGSKRAATA